MSSADHDKPPIKSRLRILVDGKNLTRPPSGIGRYIEFMVNALLKLDVEIHIAAPNQINDGYKLDPRVQIHIAEASILPTFISWRITGLPQLLNKVKPCILWGPAHRLPYRMPKEIKSLLTIHDMVWRVKSRTMKMSSYIGEFLLMPHSLEVADKIITVSDATKNDLLTYRPELSKKTEVIPCGGAALSQYTLRPDPIADDEIFILSVGTIEPRKNYENVTKAFLQIPLKIRKNFKFIIAGRKGWGNVKLPKSENIIVLDSPTADELAWLYKKCKFVVFLSLHEGFGLPILEAHQNGKAIITSNTSSMPEVAKKAAIYADPNSLVSIEKAISLLITDKQEVERLERLAIENVRLSSWESAAQSLIELALDVALDEGKYVPPSN